MLAINQLNEIICDTGEGPNWDRDSSTISWVDISGKSWHEQNIDGSNLISHKVPGEIGAIVKRRTSGYFAAVEEGFAEINKSDGYELTNNFLTPAERMNDAKVDSAGRLWAGSCNKDFKSGHGRLHVLMQDLTVKTIVTDMTLPNGLAWNSDNSEFFHVDSIEKKLWKYELDFDNLKLQNRILLVDFAESKGAPDGMCISNESYLIIAIWGGSRLEIYDLSGRKISQIDMPVLQPSSCTFAGENGERLIVTSARKQLGERANSQDGAIFIVDGVGLTGNPSEKFGG